ncbi:uncharacterized protein FOMMEDRAFT_153774 [Fomitiporia mediterranea MF3/22]|uniref:uncharacterized protein n=1 Tax=Fomitiporia mediterranea (strain MF3/22) TaxID=694068 RepID=UPI00044083CF|nr:uncharacterized protein FOMMEDRAFT_153774 [Fomitiporia mediterranea MF3/22]EJD04702.1 hypothetical protein FOMMEDRAFT_153774 [Fomitiporia mediterranea MF3/22]
MAIRGEVGFIVIASVSIVYLASLLYQPVGVLEGTSGNSTSEKQASAPATHSPASTTEETLALLSLTNILIASKSIIALLSKLLSYLSYLSYFIYLPMVVYIPIKHTLSLFLYTVTLFIRPFLPILAPVILALKILLTPIFVPLLLAYKLILFVYPLYVFLGAAAICGVSTGFSARVLSKFAVKSLLPSSETRNVQSGRSVEKRASLPGRVSRRRTVKTEE